MIFENVKVQTYSTPHSAGYYTDTVEVYYDGYTIEVGVNSKEEAKKVFDEVGIEWHYDK